MRKSNTVLVENHTESVSTCHRGGISVIRHILSQNYTLLSVIRQAFCVGLFRVWRLANTPIPRTPRAGVLLAMGVLLFIVACWVIPLLHAQDSNLLTDPSFTNQSPVWSFTNYNTVNYYSTGIVCSGEQGVYHRWDYDSIWLGVEGWAMQTINFPVSGYYNFYELARCNTGNPESPCPYAGAGYFFLDNEGVRFGDTPLDITWTIVSATHWVNAGTQVVRFGVHGNNYPLGLTIDYAYVGQSWPSNLACPEQPIPPTPTPTPTQPDNCVVTDPDFHSPSSWTPSAGATYGGDQWILDPGASLQQSAAFAQGGNYNFSMIARICNAYECSYPGANDLRLSIDGITRTEVRVNVSEWRQYTGTISIPAGSHTVALESLAGSSSGIVLYVDEICFGAPGIVPGLPADFSACGLTQADLETDILHDGTFENANVVTIGGTGSSLVQVVANMLSVPIEYLVGLLDEETFPLSLIFPQTQSGQTSRWNVAPYAHANQGYFSNRSLGLIATRVLFVDINGSASRSVLSFENPGLVRRDYNLVMMVKRKSNAALRIRAGSSGDQVEAMITDTPVDVWYPASLFIPEHVIDSYYSNGLRLWLDVEASCPAGYGQCGSETDVVDVDEIYLLPATGPVSCGGQVAPPVSSQCINRNPEMYGPDSNSSMHSALPAQGGGGIWDWLWNARVGSRMQEGSWVIDQGVCRLYPVDGSHISQMVRSAYGQVSLAYDGIVDGRPYEVYGAVQRYPPALVAADATTVTFAIGNENGYRVTVPLDMYQPSGYTRFVFTASTSLMAEPPPACEPGGVGTCWTEFRAWTDGDASALLTDYCIKALPYSYTVPSTSTPYPTPTNTPTPSSTPTNTPTPTATPTGVWSSPTPSNTPTASSTPTNTPSPTASSTPIPSATPTLPPLPATATPPATPIYSCQDLEWNFTLGQPISSPVQADVNLQGVYRLIVYGTSESGSTLYVSYLNTTTGITVPMAYQSVGSTFRAEMFLLTPSNGYIGGALVLRPSSTVTITYICLEGNVIPQPTPVGPPIVIPIPECESVNFYMRPPYTETTQILSGTLYSDVNWAEFLAMQTYNYAIYPLECTTISIANWQVEAYNALMDFLRSTTPAPPSPEPQTCEEQCGTGPFSIICRIACNVNIQTDGLLSLLIQIINWMSRLFTLLIGVIFTAIFALAQIVLGIIMGLIGVVFNLLSAFSASITNSQPTAYTQISCADDMEAFCVGLGIVIAVDQYGGQFLQPIVYMGLAVLNILLIVYVINRIRGMLSPGEGGEG